MQLNKAFTTFQVNIKEAVNWTADSWSELRNLVFINYWMHVIIVTELMNKEGYYNKEDEYVMSKLWSLSFSPQKHMMHENVLLS